MFPLLVLLVPDALLLHSHTDWAVTTCAPAYSLVPVCAKAHYRRLLDRSVEQPITIHLLILFKRAAFLSLCRLSRIRPIRLHTIGRPLLLNGEDFYYKNYEHCHLQYYNKWHTLFQNVLKRVKKWINNTLITKNVAKLLKTEHLLMSLPVNWCMYNNNQQDF